MIFSPKFGDPNLSENYLDTWTSIGSTVRTVTSPNGLLLLIREKGGGLRCDWCCTLLALADSRLFLKSILRIKCGTGVLIFEKIWRFLLKLQLILAKKNLTLVFEKNAKIFAVNWQKIAENCDHNIAPWPYLIA
jgi:hypothetical protein